MTTTSANIESGIDVALCIKKADSFDSGIDTKTDSQTIRNAVNPVPEPVLIVGTLCRLPPETPTLIEAFDARRTPARHAPLTDDELEFDLNASKIIELMRRSISISNENMREQATDEKEVNDVIHGNREDDGAVNCQSDQVEPDTAPISRDQNLRHRTYDIVEFCQTLRPPSTTTAIHYMNGLFEDIKRSVTTIFDDIDHLTTESASVVTDELLDMVIVERSDDKRTINELQVIWVEVPLSVFSAWFCIAL